MAITYPLTPPAAFKTATARWYPRTVTGVNKSPYTGAQKVISYPGSWWEVDLELPRMRPADADEVEGFILSLNGSAGTFYYGDKTRRSPRYGLPTGGSGGHPKATGTANTTTITLASILGSYYPGDWINVNGQLFRIMKATGNVLEVFPKIRASFANTDVLAQNTLGVFRLRSDVAFDIGSDKNGGPYVIPLMEAF